MSKSTLYAELAEHYSRFFPLSNEKVAFLKKLISSHKLESLLDIGTADGELPFALDETLHTISAIDPDPSMIKLAESKAKNKQSKVQFHCLSMLTLDTLNTKEFDIITCLGNTLPHLKSKDELVNFLSSVRSIMGSVGYLVIECINFENLNNYGKHYTFPTLSVEHLTFTRSYQFKSSSSILFQTELVDSRNGESLQFSIPLFFLTSDLIKGCAIEAGFRSIHHYADYSLSEPKGSEETLLFIIQK